jgi:hypothetical protein
MKWFTSRWKVVACLLWVAVVVTGFAAMEHYAITPGVTSESPLQWPSESAIAQDAQLPTMLMFAHPRCPCTRSSLEELNRTIASCPGKMKTTIVFTIPEDGGVEWTESDLVRAARESPNLAVALDRGGKEAVRFGMYTSGNVLLYTPEGALLYNGA